jgi:uncharacterized membrane protein YesL
MHMRQALRLCWSSLGDLYYELFPLALTNLLWFVCSIPQLGLTAYAAGLVLQHPEMLGGFIPLGPIAISLWLALAPALFLTLLVAAPATAGLHYVVNRFVHGEPFSPRQMFSDEPFGLRGLLLALVTFGISFLIWAVRGSTFRRYFWSSLRLAASNLGLLLLLLINIYFYTMVLGGVFVLLAVLFGYLVVLWVVMQPYLFPMLVETGVPVRTILRNSALFALDNVRLSIVVTLFSLVVWGLSISPLALIVLPFVGQVLLALAGNKAVLLLLDKYRAQVAEPNRIKRPPRRRGPAR